MLSCCSLLRLSLTLSLTIINVPDDQPTIQGDDHTQIRKMVVLK